MEPIEIETIALLIRVTCSKLEYVTKYRGPPEYMHNNVLSTLSQYHKITVPNIPSKSDFELAQAYLLINPIIKDI